MWEEPSANRNKKVHASLGS